MKLATYLERNGISDKDFAERAGLHWTEVWNYRTGRRMPKIPNMEKIKKATRGKVQAKDFLDAA